MRTNIVSHAIRIPTLKNIGFLSLFIVICLSMMSCNLSPLESESLSNLDNENGTGILNELKQDTKGTRYCRLKQLSSSRYLDAYEHASMDYSAVTRENQYNDTQLWDLIYLGSNEFRIRQKSSSRYLDAYEHASKDYSVVTRGVQYNDTQKWIIESDSLVPHAYVIKQKSSGRNLDAFEHASKDYNVVTRERQSDRTQSWYIMWAN